MLHTGRGSCEEPSHSESEDKHKEVTPTKINKHPCQEEFKGDSKDKHEEVTSAAINKRPRQENKKAKEVTPAARQKKHRPKRPDNLS